jgi:hypothetical protein
LKAILPLKKFLVLRNVSVTGHFAYERNLFVRARIFLLLSTVKM